jgi:hypothetical protein
MNLPYNFNVIGHKRANREPTIDSKGVVIDDGISQDILLGGGSTKAIADAIETGVRANVPKGTWKFWIEEKK